MNINVDLNSTINYLLHYLQAEEFAKKTAGIYKVFYI